MCSRYGIDQYTANWLRPYFRHEEEQAVGDVRPGNPAPVLISGSLAVTLTWGLPRKGGLIINDRSETLAEKFTACRRCIVPARHFYEWDAHKQRVTFRGAREKTLFLAGIRRNDAFAIVTEPADDVVRPVHDHMPMRIAGTEIQKWLDGDTNLSPVPLVKEQDIEEISLW